MFIGDVVLDPPLELLAITDAFDGVAFFASMNGNYTTELPRRGSPALNGNVDPLVPPLLLNIRSGQTQTALKCRPNVVDVTAFGKDADVVDGFAAMITP